jgi:hypothetical protein
MLDLNKWFFCLFFCFCSLIGCAVSAQAKDAQIKVELFPENGSKTGNPVTLILNGKTYPTNGWFDEMTAAGTATPDEKFIIDAVSTNKSGTVNDVRSLWTPDEQNTSFFSDPKIFASSQSFFKRFTGSAFLAKILYGSYTIFIVQHDVEGYGTTIHGYPLKNINGRFYLTNKLKDDPVFLYLSEKYSKTLQLKKR